MKPYRAQPGSSVERGLYALSLAPDLTLTTSKLAEAMDVAPRRVHAYIGGAVNAGIVTRCAGRHAKAMLRWTLSAEYSARVPAGEEIGWPMPARDVFEYARMVGGE